MKVVCVGASHGGGGGASIAMERLAAALEAAGTSVRILSLHGPEGRSPEFAAADPRLASTQGIATHVRRGLRQGRSAVTNTLFSIDWPAWDIAAHPAVRDADVVNLHWVTGFLNAESIRRLAGTGKPVVWTLHDQRAFTGGCHYAAGCAGFTADCAACPQLVGGTREVARMVLTTGRRRLRGAALTFVTPSRWLGAELRRSSLFDAACHEQVTIPNGIDVGRFAPRDDKAALRRKFGLPDRGLGIVLGSVSLTEERKGFAQALAALEELSASLRATGMDIPPPFIVTFGAGGPTINGVACHHVGRQDEAGVIDVLNAGDVFLMMTREDNLPNTVMESLACGLPVVGTRVGGVPDMIEHGRQGWLVDRDDAPAAAQTLLGLVHEPGRLAAAAAEARRHAVACYAAPLHAGQYQRLFARLHATAAPRPSPPASPAPAVAPMLRLTPAAARVVSGRTGRRRVRRFLRRMAGRLRP